MTSTDTVTTRQTRHDATDNRQTWFRMLHDAQSKSDQILKPRTFIWTLFYVSSSVERKSPSPLPSLLC
ncbi:hypothetical protein B0H12DRAFT_1168854, partial [Mycena haematopus]